jgi:hypothetical protein
MGPPRDPRDLSEYSKPYPGDDVAKQPVFSYRLAKNWDMLIYFGRHCFSLPNSIARKLADRVCSIDLIPLKRRPFGNITFPSEFRKQHVDAADAAWDEYADGSGLVYEVYTTKTPYGVTVPGDLNRIVYGPSASQIARHLAPQN